MNKNFYTLKRSLSENGFEIEVKNENFLRVKSPFEDENRLKNYFIRCENKKILVFSMIAVSDVLSTKYTRQDLAFVLSEAADTMNEYNIQVTFNEGDMIFSSLLISPQIFPFTNSLYNKVYDKIVYFKTLLDEIMSRIEALKDFS